ncbi:MAG: crotonase/enoyl-CoA hydratase family protein [Acidobacteriota bacterium]
MSAASKKVSIERDSGSDGAVWTVILERPEVRNAVDNETAEALAQAFRDFDADETAKVAVLWGRGGCFCAGADLKAVASGERSQRHSEITPESGDGPMGPSRMRLSKPVIAAVSGHAVAGGLELAIWCDLRVVEEDATFGVYCRRWGVPLIDGGTVRLPRLIGLSRALDLILTGRPVPAQEAFDIGLANRLVPSGTARTAAEALARTLLRFPEVCMNTDRASAYRSFDRPLDEAIAAEYREGRKVLELESVVGAQRFADGRGRGGSFKDL